MTTSSKTNKEIEGKKKEIAKINGLKPKDILLFVDSNGDYYDWASQPTSLEGIKAEFMENYNDVRYARFNVEHLWNWVSQQISIAEERGEESIVDRLLKTLPVCSGCTYDKDEGTHQSMSKHHFEEFYLTHKSTKGNL